MWNLEYDTNELIYNTEPHRLTDTENKFMVTKGEARGGINLKFEMSRYKLLYIK